MANPSHLNSTVTDKQPTKGSVTALLSYAHHVVHNNCEDLPPQIPLSLSHSLQALAVNVVCREWGFSNQLKWHRHRKYLFTWVGDYWVETAGGLPSAANVWSSLLFAKLDINCICINHTLLWAILLRPRSEIRLVCGRGGWRCGGKQ